VDFWQDLPWGSQGSYTGLMGHTLPVGAIHESLELRASFTSILRAVEGEAGVAVRFDYNPAP
jgi:hypothetical protein